MARNDPVRYVSTFRAPSEYERQLEEARRRAMLAEALAQQQYEPQEGVVAPIPRAAPLVKALQGFMTARAGRKAKEAEEAAEKAGRREAVDYIRSFEPEQRNVGMGELAAMEAPTPMMEDGRISYAPPSAVAAPNQRLMPAMGPDGQPDFSQQMQMQVGGPLTEAQKRARALEGLESANPMVRAYAADLMKPPEAEEFYAPTDTAEGLVQFGKRGGRKDTGVAAPPKQTQQTTTQRDYEYAVSQGYKGTFEQFRRANAPVTNIDLGNKTANKYADELAGLVAKQDAEAIAIGETAINQIESSYRVRDLLKKNPITGTGAEARLAFEKALATAGFTKGDRASVTENLSAELAKTTLAAIRTSGLGSGQGFTDKDRQFLERAAAGQISLTLENLNYLAELNEKAGRANIAISNRVRARARRLPQFQNLPNMFPDIVAPAAYESKSAASADPIFDQANEILRRSGF